MVNATKVPYDLTNITNTKNIVEFVKEVNILTNEWFMTGILFAGFVILFVSMQSNGKREALMVSSFIIAVLSIFFRMMDFVSTSKVVIIMVIFTIIFVGFLFTARE